MRVEEYASTRVEEYASMRVEENASTRVEEYVSTRVEEYASMRAEGRRSPRRARRGAPRPLATQAVELASLLAAKGDEASTLRAHRVLAECGVHLGLWGMGELHRPKNPAAPMGAVFDGADLRSSNARGAFFDEADKLSLDVKGASRTSLKGAPPLV